MRHWIPSSVVMIALIAAGSGASAQLQVTPQPSSDEVPRYMPFELRLLHDASPYSNPFWDVAVTATFTSPGGALYPLEGFYYDTNAWMVRFAPLIEGLWSYSVTMAAGTRSYQTSGAFFCVSSDLDGPLRIDPDNSEHLVRDDGVPFHPLGTNFFTYEHPAIDGLWIGNESTPLPRRWAEYFETYRARGANLWRRILDNEHAWNLEDHLRPGSPPYNGGNGIWNDSGVDRYSLPRARVLDTELRAARAHNMAVILALLNNQTKWETHPLNACNGGPFPPPLDANGQPDCHADRGHPADLFALSNTLSLAYHQKYVRYIVARYSAFVDIWELFNEFDESDRNGNARRMGLSVAWKSSMAQFVRAKAPYHDLVSTTRVDPGPVTDAWQDVCISHNYTTHPDAIVCASGHSCEDRDRTACARIVDSIVAGIPRQRGRPDLVDEFGFDNNIPNDDPAHHRVAVWTALHRDIGLVFWDANTRAECFELQNEPCGSVRVSAYISNAARALFDIRQAYAAKLPSRMRVAAVQPEIPFPAATLRAFGLADRPSGVYSAYVHDYFSHTESTDGALISIGNLQNESHEALWFNPRTGATVSSFSFFGPQLSNATIPEFAQDIALLVRPLAPVHILTTSLPSPAHHQPYYFKLKARGGGMPYTWSLVNGALPNGMVLEPRSGTIVGTPRYGGAHRFTVEVSAGALATGGGPSTDRVTLSIGWTDTFASNATQDGFVVERAPGSGQGGSSFAARSDAFGLSVGDDAADRAGVTLVSFDTSSLPNNAVVDAAEVHLTSNQAVSGAVAPLFPLFLDVRAGAFGSGPVLESADFQAAATATRAASLGEPVPGTGPTEYVLVLDAAGRQAVNRFGLTQCRLQLLGATDHDGTLDALGFCSGEYADPALRPRLVVRYH